MNTNYQIEVIDAEPLEFLPAKTLLQLVERSQQATKNLKEFKRTVSALPELFRRLEELDIDLSFNLDSTWIGLRFTGDGARLTDVWRALRLNGYSTVVHPKKGDTEVHAFWKHEGQVELFMCFSSSLCKRVQVGTKMVEQPIYETQCGDLPELGEPADKAVVVSTPEQDDDLPF